MRPAQPLNHLVCVGIASLVSRLASRTSAGATETPYVSEGTPLSLCEIASSGSLAAAKRHQSCEGSDPTCVDLRFMRVAQPWNGLVCVRNWILVCESAFRASDWGANLFLCTIPRVAALATYRGWQLYWGVATKGLRQLLLIGC